MTLDFYSVDPTSSGETPADAARAVARRERIVTVVATSLGVLTLATIVLLMGAA